MYTRCPGCHTVHPLNAAILAGGNGKYRCGKCNKVSNALESLFNDWPKSGEKPAEAGDMPVLGLPIDLETAAQSRKEPDQAALVGEGLHEPPRERGPWLRFSWILGGILVLLAITVWLGNFFGTPITEQPEVKQALQTVGVIEKPRRQVFRDLDAIHLVNREIRTAPNRDSLLVLEATIVNRADRKQPYPTLVVVLLDRSGRVLSRSRFVPRDYLASGSDVTAGMTPDAYLPFTVEIDDPGQRAVGFELDFE